MTKITVVGSGNLGSQAAFYAGLKQLADVVLIDIVDGLPQGKALDLQQAMAISGSDIKFIGTNNYEPSKDSDIVIVSAGVPRKPGMSRDDLIDTNKNIIKSVIPEIVKYSPNCILIIITNPIDAMVQLAYNLSKFPKQRVIGMAGVLDSARFKTLIAQECNTSVNDVQAMVLGSHGDLMVPVIGQCKVKDQPITELLSKEKIDEIIQKVKDGGAEIVKFLKTGSAFFAPSLAAIEITESILKDQKKILPCATLLEGEYGVNNIFVGVPVKLGKNGVEEIIEIKLTKEEKKAFNQSVEKITNIIKEI